MQVCIFLEGLRSKVVTKVSPSAVEASLLLKFWPIKKALQMTHKDPQDC